MSQPTLSRAALSEAAAAEAEAAAAAANNPTVAANLKERARKLRNEAEAASAVRAVGGLGSDWLRALGEAEALKRFGPLVANTLRNMDLGFVNEELVSLLVRRRAMEAKAVGGAVLVFLPGRGEIDSLAEILEQDSSLLVARLHSQLSSAEQKMAFATAPKGKSKVLIYLIIISHP
ncbi:hypothetical protein T492DRAFT_445048 [Pavlovales sp. CCMP2436]|nr:hypothetical protein T492DRAFT_445048 [Pavlovales sp. CCMP2436]